MRWPRWTSWTRATRDAPHDVVYYPRDEHPGAGLPPGVHDVHRDADGRPSHVRMATFRGGPPVSRGAGIRAPTRRGGWLGMALAVTVGAILAIAIIVGYVLLLGIGPA